MTERRRNEAADPAGVGSALHACESHFRAVLESVAQGVIYQDARGHVVDANAAALRILGRTLDDIRGRTLTDPLWRAICADGSDYPPALHPSVIALRTGTPERAEMGIYNPAEESYRWIEVTAMPYFRAGESSPSQVHTTFDDVPERRRLEAERDRLVHELEDAMASLKVLRGFIPICASCKKIRNDAGYWLQLEVYMREHSEAQFTHGVCPDCMVKLYPEFADGEPKG